MLGSRQIPWPRILAEAVAIVSSILLAFWIQAWWDDRQLRDEEKQVLSALAEEFVRLENLVISEREYYTAILSSLVALVEIGGGTREKPNTDELDKFFGDSLWYGFKADWTSSDIDSIISSGDLGIISNPSLRRDISRWAARLENLQEAIELDRNVNFNRLLPYLSANINVPALATIPTASPGSGPEQFNFPVEINAGGTPDHQELLNRQDYINLLWERIGFITDILYFHLGYIDPEFYSVGTMSDDLRKTIDLINQEIERL